MDPVYQDELILGFQSMIDDKWSWGVRGIYRKLNNAIDDMEITSTGIVCDGAPVGAGFVMGNPGEALTVFTDTNCDGENDAFVTIDTAQGRLGHVRRRRQLHRRRGLSGAEARLQGARVHDRPCLGRSLVVQCHVHAVVQRGQRRRARSTRTPISATRAAPRRSTTPGSTSAVSVICRTTVATRSRCAALTRSASTGSSARRWQCCPAGRSARSAAAILSTIRTSTAHFIFNAETGEYELHKRGTEGRTPWLFDLGANVTFRHSFSAADLQVKLPVYNLFNQQRITEVDEFLGGVPIDPDSTTSWVPDTRRRATPC